MYIIVVIPSTVERQLSNRALAFWGFSLSPIASRFSVARGARVEGPTRKTVCLVHDFESEKKGVKVRNWSKSETGSK